MKTKVGLLILGGLIVASLVSLVDAQEDNNPNPYIDPAIYEALNMSDSVRAYVFVNTTGNERLYETKLKILANLTESEFELKYNPDDTDWFSGELTKEGLEKLKTNEKILRIEKVRGVVAYEQIDSKEEDNQLLYVILIIILLVTILYFILRRRKR